MADDKVRFQPNAESVSAKVLDGEAVLIHITRGTYHSMEKVGSRIWQLIEGRQTLGTIASIIAGEYDVRLESAQKDVAELIAALFKEDLITVATLPPTELDISRDIERVHYEVPNLSTHHDMKDLLALDPPMPGLQSVGPDSDSREN
jgi:hypothetical protein